MTNTNPYKFLQGGGEMGKLIRSIDWSQTAIGDVATWPAELKIATGIMLSTPFPMYIAWGKEYIQLYNDGYRPILGATKHPQAMGISTRETFAEIWHIIESMFDGVMDGQAVGFPNFMLPLDRNGYVEECFFDFSYSPISDEDGNIGGVLVTVIEITEKVKTLADLQQAKQDLETAKGETEGQRDQLKRFFMEAPAAICVTNGPEFVFELINPLYQQFFPERQILGKPVLDALPEIRGPVYDILKGVYNDDKTFEGNELLIPLARYDGGPMEDRYFNFIYQPRHNSIGKVDGILVFAFEVTDMVNAKKELEKEKDKFKLAILAAELGTFDMDMTKGTMEWDDRCRELFGIDHEEIVTYEKDFLQGLHPDDKERVIKVIERVFNRSESNGFYDVEYRTIGVADKKVRWLRAKGQAYFDNEDKPYRFIGSVLEVTDKKQEELRKNDFITMVSHELKTPLSALSGYVQMLHLQAAKNMDTFAGSILGKVGQQVKKMTGIINGFLNISQIEAGKIPLNKRKFAFADLVNEIIEAYTIIAPDHSITNHIYEPIIIHADYDRLEQVLLNLLNNAVKYSPNGKKIDITSKVTGEMLRVSVKDEGLGIEPSDVKKLFDRFFRVDNHHTKAIPGFGIGLYLCSEIIRLHEGRIWVESEIGSGSTFIFELPIMDSTEYLPK
ncbi:ATP-binding protein [Mucilaginibacter glaciei]|uniref:histidine kinase n=1 Tax=Mucilaginibacter glaciei TaxID=2772109 RepID=A0A926NSY9_9SPHI|nr:ATP-binding protein [Mucilaginibacter glaciei]MBD1395521.1 PAS domain-containing protein [Mucilaginibacter glaciei]